MAAGHRRVDVTKPPFDEQVLTAYHEAGHAVLSAALADLPHRVSIRADGASLGRSGARMSGRISSRAQVHLAGFAAEQLLTGARPPQFDHEVGFAILESATPDLGDGFESTDGYLVVRALLAELSSGTDDAIRAQVEHYFQVALASLAAVWPSVKAVAEALLEQEELDRAGIETVLGTTDLFTPVFAVQREHGLLLPEAGRDGTR